MSCLPLSAYHQGDLPPSQFLISPSWQEKQRHDGAHCAHCALVTVSWNKSREWNFAVVIIFFSDWALRSCFGRKPPADVLRLHWLDSHRGRVKSIDHASGPGVLYQNGLVGCIDQWEGDWGVVTERFTQAGFQSLRGKGLSVATRAVSDFTLFSLIHFIFF